MTLGMKIFGLNTRWRALPYVFIFSVSLIGLMLLVSNPGYFSHDELQKWDHVNRSGLKDYFIQYLAIKPGDTFGTPVRPFSFMVQGLLAPLMGDFTVLVHLFSVLSHAAVACLIYIVVLQLGGGRLFGLAAALIFVLNPMTTLAVGWSAALMDRLYIFWGLAALFAANHYILHKKSHFLLFWIFIFSALATLSKETAVILPAVLLMLLFVDSQLLRSKRFYYAGISWAIPVTLFIAYRLPSLVASFGSPSVSSYKASVLNVPDNLLVYLSYPFLFMLTEARNWVFVESLWIWASLILHSLLVVALYRQYGIRAIVGYLFFYILFLLPVLLIPNKGAHYLYGSGIIMSVSIAALLISEKPAHIVVRAGAGLVLILMLVHTLILQSFVYGIGTCMNRAMISSESLYLSNESPAAMDFQAEPDAPAHVLHRVFTGRDQIGKSAPVKFSISNWEEPSPVHFFTAKMNGECIISRRK